MTHDPEGSLCHSRLQKQVVKFLDEDTEAIELVERLDFGFIESNDQYADWHASTPMLPMVRALFLKELEDYSYSEVYRKLDSNPSDAEALGFESVPARTTFGRAWRDRFDDGLRQKLEFNARKIRELANERGCPIGLQALEPEEQTDASQRTRDRFINRKAKEVTEEMQRLLFPAFEFDRAENARYESDAFCELQSHLGLSSSAAESGTDLFADDTTRDGSPDADTHLYNIKRLEPADVQRMVDEAVGRMVHRSETPSQVRPPRRRCDRHDVHRLLRRPR